ncbi:MAG TPA: hypothetical protein VGN55_08770 [Xanthobacteraceae bacterium]|jgi:flagellar hook protein FlgE
MSSAIGIAPSGTAAAGLQRQASGRDFANNSATAPAPDASAAGLPAAVASRASSAAAPNVDLSNQIVQQTTTSHAIAANAKAIQAGSSAIASVLDITV